MKRFPKIFIIFLIVVFVFQANFAFVPMASAQFFGEGIPDDYDIVAVLVDDQIYGDPEEYGGLREEVRGAGLPKTTIRGRINRYVDDIQKKLEKTRAMIIPVSRQETTERIMQVLERLYFEGDPSSPRKRSRLVGAIFVGEVPLPIVNKNGNRFLSMFPYIDFEQKAYVWNPETKDFERDNSVSSPKVEIWHGVIRSPIRDDTAESRDMLAGFFDKNHLYHTGHPLYSRFGENLFYADLFFEKKGINPFKIQNYLQFLEHIEDKAYYRNTREFLAALRRQFEGNIGESEEGFSPEEQAQIQAQRERSAREARDAARRAGYTVPLGEIPDEPDEQLIPDILAKPLIEKYLSEYKDVFTTFAALMNDFATYTGRYKPEENLDTMVNLMTAKDKYTMLYLREVNDRIEREIDDFIAENLAQDIPLIDTAKISLAEVSIKKSDGSGTVKIENNEDGFSFPETVFSNHSLSHHLEVPENHDVLGREIRTPDYIGGIWGNQTENIQNASQCSLYRGSLPSEGNLISKLVTLGRQYFLRTAERNVTPLEKETLPAESEEEARREFRVNPYKEHGGCYYPNLAASENPAQNRCFPEAAHSPIALSEGTKAVDALPPGADDYRSCYLIHEKTQYQNFYQFAVEFLQEMSRQNREDLRENITARRGVPPEKYRDLSEVPMFAATDAGLLASGLRGIPRDSLRLNLKQVILQIPGVNPDDPFSFSSAIFENPLQDTLKIIFQNHPRFESVTLKWEPNVLKNISSVFYHKEPTAETLKAQIKGLTSESLPVDNPRYVTFFDREGRLRRIDYPNVFRSRTLADFKEALIQKETELGEDMSEEWQNIFEDDAAYSEDHVKDAIEWKEMNLSQRHRYLAMTYLDPSKNGYVGERVNGYELFVLNGESEDSENSLSVNFEMASLPPSEEFLEIQAQQEREEERVRDIREGIPGEEVPVRRGGGCNVTELREGLPLFDLSDFPNVCSPWLIGIQQWLRSLTPETSIRESQSDDEFYQKLEEKKQADKEALRQQNANEDDQAYLDPSDWSAFTRAASLEIIAPFPILQKNRESDVTVTVVSKDTSGNILRDEFTPLDLGVEGAGIIFTDPTDDNDATKEGFQTATITGSATIRLKATNLTGEGTFTASIPGTGITASIPITVVEEAKLVLSTNDLAVQADGERVINGTISVEDQAGQMLSQVNGMVAVEISDSAFGEILEPLVSIRNGQGRFRFQIGKKSGKVTVTARSGGLAEANLEIELLPGPPHSLNLSQEAESKVSAKVFDAFGNLVYTDNRTEVTFAFDSSSEGLARYSGESPLRVINGIAENTVLFEAQATVRILAGAEGLVPSALEITPKIKLTDEDIKNSDPESLAVALLGMPAGDITQENSLGQWFAFSGKVQSVVSLTAPPEMQVSLMSINQNGGITFSDTSRISANILQGENPIVQLADTFANEIIGEMTMIPRENRGVSVITDEPFDSLEEGVYIKIINPELSIQENGGKASLLFRSNEIGNVGNSGKISLFDPSFTMKVKEGPFLTFEIQKNNRTFAEIYFIQRFSEGVSLTEEERVSPGVSVRPFGTLAQVSFQPSHAGSSTAELPGLQLVSKEEVISGNAAPGFAYRSLEDSLENPGVGFTLDNKFALLFSGGATFGEANMLYASDIGIVLGDPTVHLDNSREDGFAADIGEHVFSADTEIKDLIDIDVDGDRDQDLLIAHGKGDIEFLENTGDGRGFRDRGLILSLKNGIQSIAKGDVNRDSLEDLVIAVTERCRKTDTCLDVYENTRGSFVRKNLPIDQTEKLQLVKTADLNDDGDLDLVTMAMNGDIKAYYNHDGEFDLEGQEISNVGLSMDPAKNLIPSVLAAYSAMSRYEAGNPSFRTIPIGGSDVAFIYADTDPALQNSTKYGQDFNGETVESGDRLRYEIILRNTSGRQLNNVHVSDVFPAGFELDPSSVSVETLETDDDLRKIVFRGFSIPARSQFTLTYEGTYTAPPQSTQEYVMAVSPDLSDDYPSDDDYPDLMVTVKGNPTGRVRYFYSTGIRHNGRVIYDTAMGGESVSKPETAEEARETLERQLTENQSPETLERKKREANDLLDSQVSDDPDRDGIPRMIDELEGALDNTADIVEGAVSALKCSTGCLALPLNYAFFAPGAPSLLGIPVGFDPGLPALDTGPPPPFVGVFGGGLPAPASTFRLYISPTLTGGLGFGICLGPWLAGQCFNFGIDPLTMLAAAGGPNICDSINENISGALAKANDVISSANNGTIFNLGSQNAGSSANPRESGGLLNYQLGSYEAPSSRTRNVLVPGFPSVITEWFRAQIAEITSKLFDLPDLYVIYPDLSSIYGAFVPQAQDLEIESIADILTWLNSLPLVDIETEVITFKVPWIDKKEFDRVKFDWQQWILDLQNEWEKLKQFWKCGSLQETIRQCTFVQAQVDDLIKTVNQNIRNIEEYLLLPKKILDYAQIEERYITQLIDYLDTITRWTGGWVQKNKSRVIAWRKFARDVKNLAKSWEPIFKVALEYMESCDRCKTERFTLMELVMKLFVAIPSPPVIPFPKLPDIVVDVSKIQAGLRILWPDVQFKPEPLIIPKLPRIKLPIPEVGEFGDLDPNAGFRIVLPKIPLISKPPELPRLPTPPSLLELKLPNLPDIPPPPKLPQIPAEFRTTLNLFKKIVKIACLVKTGLVPVPEYNLKPQLEAQTARPLSPLLPVDTLFTIQVPSANVEYIDKIEITAHSNFQADFTGLKEGVAEIAETANASATDFVDEINKTFKDLSRSIEGYLSPKVEFPGQGFDVDPNRLERIPEIRINKDLENDAKNLAELIQTWTAFAPKFENLAKQYAEASKKMPKEIRIEADVQNWIPSHRTLSEIAAGIPSQSYETDFEKSVAQMRDSLITYVKDRKESLQSFGTSGKIASLSFPFENGLKKRLFASSNLEIKQSSAGGKVKLGEITGGEDVTPEKSSLQSFDKRLLALADGEAPEGGPEDGNINYVGMFAVNPETGKAERILNYTYEADAETKQLFMGRDLVYSQGRNVYFKRFDERPDDEDGYHFSLSRVAILDFESLIPNIPAINKVSQANSTADTSLITFEANANAFGYEVRASRAGETRIFDFLNEEEGAATEQQGIKIEKAKARLGRFSGPVRGKIYARQVVDDGADNILAEPGEILHALEDDTEIILFVANREPITLTLQSFDIIRLSDQFGGRIMFSVENGSVEIIGKNISEEILQPGMMVFEEQELQSLASSFEVLFSNGARRPIEARASYTLGTLNDNQNPTVTLNLPQGHYQATVTAFDQSGNLGTRGEKILLNPQVCGDDTKPFADSGRLRFTVPLLKTLDIDPSKSFDPGGSINRYVLDLHPDEAGETFTAFPDNPKFTVGPFERVGIEPAKLTVFDQAENDSSVDIEIEVVAPSIDIDPNEFAKGNIHGTIIPPDENVPITISRFRNGIWELIKSKSANIASQYFTDPSGRFEIDDLDLRDRLIVKNHEGKIAAEVNRENGRIIILDDQYHLEAFPAEPGRFPTRIGIVDADGTVLSYVFFMPDVNTDVQLDPQSMEYTAENYKRLSGVHVKSFLRNNSDFSFAIQPGSDSEYPGAALLSRDAETAAIVDVNGDIIFFDEKLRLKVKEGEFEDPVVFEMFYGSTKIAEIFIAVQLGDKKIEIIDEGELAPIEKPQPILYPFADISPNDPLRQTLKGLYDRGIIQGYEDARGQLTYRPHQNISRAEFTKITLGMLCIVPRDEAKIPPPVFSDIPPAPKQWFYEYTKEANLQGFIFGYQAECVEQNFCPFKPQNEINRAEAVKIILEALEKLDAIDLSKLNKNADPWYEPYIKIATDLRPYLKNKENIAGYILLTAVEARDPTKKITRGEFAMMADRVLKIRDCYAEKNPDPDGDEVPTALENQYGTDPYDPDTDKGGIKDGVEISRGSDPLDPRDDNPIEFGEGLFITRPTCTQCPCAADIVFGQDLMQGDTVFGAILKVNPDGTSEILVRSKELNF